MTRRPKLTEDPRRDVKARVEWLKEECQKHENYGKKSWLFKKIDEAFEDL